MLNSHSFLLVWANHGYTQCHNFISQVKCNSICILHNSVNIYLIQCKCVNAEYFLKQCCIRIQRYMSEDEGRDPQPFKCNVMICNNIRKTLGHTSIRAFEQFWKKPGSLLNPILNLNVNSRFIS